MIKIEEKPCSTYMPSNHFLADSVSDQNQISGTHSNTNYALCATKSNTQFILQFFHFFQDPENKQYFFPDKKMAKVMGEDRMRAFGMTKYLSAHLS